MVSKSILFCLLLFSSYCVAQEKVGSAGPGRSVYKLSPTEQETLHSAELEMQAAETTLRAVRKALLAKYGDTNTLRETLRENNGDDTASFVFHECSLKGDYITCVKSVVSIKSEYERSYTWQ